MREMLKTAMHLLKSELGLNCLSHPVEHMHVAFTSHFKSARLAPALEGHCNLTATPSPSRSSPLLNSISTLPKKVLLASACNLLCHLCHHLWTALNSKPSAAINPKPYELIQPLLREPSEPFQQMAPDLLVADEPKEATRGSTRVEKGVWIQVKKDGKDLAVREAFQPWKVVSFETADVHLSHFVWKVIRGQTSSPVLPPLSSCQKTKAQYIFKFQVCGTGAKTEAGPSG